MSIDPSHLERLMEESGRVMRSAVCPRCGYNLAGATSNRCTECGTIILATEMKRASAEVLVRISQLKGINSVLRLGVKIGVAGMSLLALGLILGQEAVWLGKTCGFACGIVSFALGIGYVRVYRLPPWARDELPEKPNGFMAAASIILGLALLAMTFISF